MVTDLVTLFTQSTLRSLSVIYNRHVVSIDVWGSLDRNPHHPQIVSEPTECFHSVFHCQKICTETDVSIVGCFLDIHQIKSVFTNIRNPVLDLRVALYLEWLLSTCILNSTMFPLSSGISVGISSFTLAHNSTHLCFLKLSWSISG